MIFFGNVLFFTEFIRNLISSFDFSKEIIQILEKAFPKSNIFDIMLNRGDL
ncbi:hypothetical protein AF66_08430 [Streptococcus uberis B190]|nr:hypothetical protein AF66_08430 [Streptococcus uberis B190]